MDSRRLQSRMNYRNVNTLRRRKRQTRRAFFETLENRYLLANAIVTRGWGLLELRPMRMSLEDVFLQVTTEEQPQEATASDQAPALGEHPEEAPRA